MEIHIGDRVAEIELVSKEDNKVVLTIDGKPFEADVVMAENGTCNILMDGRSANAQLIRRENGKSYKVNTHYSSFNVEICVCARKAKTNRTTASLPQCRERW